MARSKLIACIFCGQRKAGSEEHVIPQWVRGQLGITSPVTTLVRPSGEQHVDPHLAVKLRRHVCVDCNGGWMSRLERSVKPFLGPMLVHEGNVDLDPEQQQNLAKWAVMKVLLLELAMRQQHPRRRPNHGYAPSVSELAWLYGKDQPPPRCRVWLGAFDAKNTLVATTRAKSLGMFTATSEKTLPAHVTTMTIGYVLFQVFSIDFVAADAQGASQFDGTPPDPFDRTLMRIWPMWQPVVRWPGLHVIEGMLDRVVTWSLRPPGSV